MDPLYIIKAQSVFRQKNGMTRNYKLMFLTFKKKTKFCSGPEERTYLYTIKMNILSENT